MKKNRLTCGLMVLLLLIGTGMSFGQDKNIVETAIASDDHTTLVAAVKAADLVGTLSDEGPYTVFAPTNAAFEKLPDGTVATLLKPENKSKLTGVLTYHVVAGNFRAKDIIGLIEKGNGVAVIPTVNGTELTAMVIDGSVYLKDKNGNKAKVIAADLKQSNGVIHVIDTVILPI